MNPGELNDYLHANIPLAEFMHVSVVSVSPDSLVLSAPLEPNVNVHQTVFGGSAASIALIAAWSLLHVRMSDSHVAGNVVVHQHRMTYFSPIKGRFTTHAGFATPTAWDEFVHALRHKGRARVTLVATLQYDGHRAAQLEGEFVARTLGQATTPDPVAHVDG
jgi:thioesterase domain-containing protein